MVNCGRPPKKGELRQRYGISILPSVRNKAYTYGINMSQLLENSINEEIKRREDENVN